MHDAALLCLPFIPLMHSLLLNSSIYLNASGRSIHIAHSKELRVVRSGDLGGHSTVPLFIKYSVNKSEHAQYVMR